MKYSVLLCLSVLLSLSAGSSVSAQQNFKTTTTSVIGYLEYLPADYLTNSSKYPVVVFLHGIGERGPDSTDPAVLANGISTVTRHGPPKHVRNGTQFPFILISPQLKNSFGVWPTWYVTEVIEHVKKYLRIDERRIYLTGLSLGGGGTWTMAQDFPGMFAAVAPVCGGYNSPAKACAIASENLPVWAFHGDADAVVHMSKSINMVNAINSCLPAPVPPARITIYPGVAHNAWDRAYTPDYTYHKPNVYEWMLSGVNTFNRGNRIPIANAGSDKTTSLRSLALQGSATDSDGSIVSYAWSQISGGAAVLTNTATSRLSLSGLVIGEYMFRLTVMDNAGNTDSDYVRVVVQHAPLANAGTDKSITLPLQKVTVTGSGTDTDGSIVAYNWKQISGPLAATITNASTPTMTAAGMSVSGEWVFELSVKDNAGAVGRDRMRVVVSPDPGVTTVNAVPVVSAGADQMITLPTTSLKLTGTASDPDGNIVSYSWSHVSGPARATLTNANAASVSVSGLTVEGFYVYKLTVTDNKGAIAWDKVGVTVKGTVVSAASLRSADVLIQQAGEPSGGEGEAISLLPENTRVSVYSGEGKQIFTGIWKAEYLHTLLQPRQVYIFHAVEEASGRIIKGKVMVTGL